MRALHVLQIWAAVQAIPFLSLGIYCAYPSGCGAGSGNCVGVADVGLGPLRREVYDNGEIFDITHKFTPHTPVGGSTEGIGQFLTLLMSMKNGSAYNFSEMKLRVHSGTHVDAPGHMYENYFEEGYDVDSLDLRVLNGNYVISNWTDGYKYMCCCFSCFHNFPY